MRATLWLAAASVGFHVARIAAVPARTQPAPAPAPLAPALAPPAAWGMSAPLATSIARLDSDDGLGAWAWLLGDRGLLPRIERAAAAEGAGVVAAGLAPLDDAEARLAQWLVLRYAGRGILDDGPTPLSPPADAALRSLQRLLWRGWLRSPPVGGP